MDGTIKGILLQLIRTEIKATVISCTVVSVNTTDCLVDCDPLNGDARMLDVKLKAVADGTGTGVIIFPKVGSYVNVAIEGNNINKASVIGVSEFDRILISQANGFKMEVTATGDLKFNDGTLGGMVKVNNLVTRLNAIESDLNQLKTAFNTWVVVPGDGGAALKAIAATWSTGPLTQTTVSNIENPKIKQ